MGRRLRQLDISGIPGAARIRKAKQPAKVTN
jgi:hypothetical protein